MTLRDFTSRPRLRCAQPPRLKKAGNKYPAAKQHRELPLSSEPAIEHLKKERSSCALERRELDLLSGLIAAPVIQWLHDSLPRKGAETQGGSVTRAENDPGI